MINFKAIIGFVLMMGGLLLLSGGALIALLQHWSTVTAFFIWVGLVAATDFGCALLFFVIAFIFKKPTEEKQQGDYTCF